MYDMSGFSYDITDVVHLLQLRVRHKNSSSMDVNCPFCGETKGKMNVNLQKNVFRCNRCDASGGMLELYGRLHGVSSAEANRQIREALGKGEYRTDYQVVHKEEPVEIFNAELADADVIDRTYQEMLSLLTLNDKHQEDLKKRGLTKEQIEIQRYRSVPLFGIKNMVQKLLESGQTLKILKTAQLINNIGQMDEEFSVKDNPVLQRTCCRRAFLRGAFLSAGSITDPEKNYHFEIACISSEKAAQIKELFEFFGLEAKIVLRKKYYVVYLKEGAMISDTLNIMEAHIALMKFENVRILKDVRNSVNRRVNCEAANINKTVSAARKQIEDIEYIKNTVGLERLSENLRDIAYARLEEPDATLKELGEKLSSPVGKSGVNHRLRKLSQIAQDIREKGHL